MSSQSQAIKIRLSLQDENNIGAGFLFLGGVLMPILINLLENSQEEDQKIQAGVFCVIDLSWSVCPDLSIKFLISQAGTP